MQNRECIVFERTLQPIVGWIRLHQTRIAVAFARWNFLFPAAKKKITLQAEARRSS